MPSGMELAGAVAPAPAGSVVMATWNRSNIIGWAIRSLQAQTFGDWELLVVGDACTDDTAAVVAAFGDPRIRFHNRPRNFGEQSAANNDGVARARGRYLAYLNHDDLWLPGHLASCVQALETSGADLVFTAALQYGADLERPRLRGAATWTEAYHPGLSVPASLWVLRRDLAQRIGNWRPARTLRTVPSQDWLLRAHRAGARMLALRELTAILLTSGDRRNAYRDREQSVHEQLAPRLEDPRFVGDGLLKAVIAWEDRRLRRGGARLVADGLHSLLSQLLAWLGVMPPRAIFWIENLRKGQTVRRLRRRRGLPGRMGSDDDDEQG